MKKLGLQSKEISSNTSKMIETLIHKYDLKPHPEGGFGQLLYEDPGVLDQVSLPNEYNGSRPYWNGIYFLLPEGTRSILHRLRMNELWNFYLGGPLQLFQISPDGEFTTITLGANITAGQEVAHVFPKGHWIGAKPMEGSGFSLVSCITAPGFTFDDWEKGQRELLLKQFPHLEKTILILTDG